MGALIRWVHAGAQRGSSGLSAVTGFGVVGYMHMRPGGRGVF